MLKLNKKSLLLLSLLSLTTVASASEGVVGTSNKKGLLSVVISGEVAHEINNRLEYVNRVYSGTGASQVIVSKGKQITCTKKTNQSQCSLTIDDKGTLNAAIVSSESNAGKVSATVVDGRLAVSVSGKAVVQILNTMKNVTTTGTMTTTKESGDIRCSMVREFKVENGTCRFFIDSSGSASSK